MEPFSFSEVVEAWSTQTNWSDVSDTGHTCSGVPARHILELLYTTALGTQGQPIHQVVGARTRIDTETWPLNVNLEDTTISHDFLLTSSVVFVQVPISDSPPRSRFWDRMLSQEHSENAWRNIFSALEPMTTGDEIAEVSVFTMSLVLLAVSLTALLWDQL
uniref:Uncharacterized protein n=1 Tax=Timema tahoe TaxID=61484 RepID=A0A7R9NWS3_9NEOP|nr:unnamed protein product [Timema tahoe]